MTGCCVCGWPVRLGERVVIPSPLIVAHESCWDGRAFPIVTTESPDRA